MRYTIEGLAQVYLKCCEGLAEDLRRFARDSHGVQICGDSPAFEAVGLVSAYDVT